jgi:hypothetical protein
VKIDLALSHDGALWRARGATGEHVAPDLAALDAMLAEAYARPDAPVSIAVRFDFDTVPRWWRQYHAHYFNYELRLPPREVQQ